ncbi:hypothetical protein UFOVP240_53 [uncultured Caudovirales phage]|uniref:Uncharacterized protein n=1 Tax=uncultured Caudovirales phage TaxID=2100421 RepID=A0A6J7X0X8_9CAUD|nr:hypothetical protein UFOVP240_53 [uncultured Caudovirales phage]
MSKWYEISYPAEPYDVVEIWSEERIIREYWPYWKGKMDEKFGEGYAETTHANCIDDWIVGNWAVEVKKPHDH